jgi:hypothetical protein
MGPTQESRGDDPILVFIAWPKCSLPEMLYCHDEKYTFPVKKSDLSQKCPAVECLVIVLGEQIRNGQIL